MKHRNLVQYIFEDGHEQIADERKRIILVRDPEGDYSPLKERFTLRVKGSTFNPNDSKHLSKIPQERQYLITSRNFIIFKKYYISEIPVREINKIEL